MADTAPREEGQPHAAAQFEEGDRAVLEFLADDALAGQPKPLPVERQRPLQVVDPEERDLLRLKLDGLTNDQAAEQLGTSERTVRHERCSR